MAIDLSQFHQVFYEESFEGLQVMEASLLEMDCGSPDKEVINTIFRAAHSIKGSSGTFGFTDVTEFTHVLETLLDQIRDGRRAIEQQHIDLFLESVDCLRAMLTDLQNGQKCDTKVSHDLQKQFNAILEQDGQAHEAKVATVTDKPPASGLKRWRVRFVPGPNILQTGNEPARMFRELAELGTLQSIVFLDRLPDFSALNPESCYFFWELQLDTDASEAKIREVFEWVVDESEVVCENLSSAPAKAAPAASPLPQKSESASSPAVKTAAADVPVVKKADDDASKDKFKHVEAASIRVSTDKIDSLVNLVGELVITQSMLSQIGSEFDPGKLAKLQEGLAQLEHNTRELQESVMRIRMLPINFSFSRFPRMARDLSKQLGKKVEIHIQGEQTELDKTVMERIGDPLVHLVRNSLDHGLETPDERIAAGKSETGIITLNAFHQGGSIVIEVFDDGRGLNADKIRAKAIKNGIIQDHELLTQEQINELIFQPGFSTADAVTDVSGRGVGMDVVRRNIQELNGTIDVHSELGKGTKFTIRLPLTLAILDGQLIQVGHQTYIIPLISIVESMQARPELVNHVAGGCDVLRLREEYIPIVKLWDIFGIEPHSRDLADNLFVVVEVGAEKVAVVVDDLLGQQQVVIKSMESNYRKVDGISGATILGDGTVSLILEITDLIRMAGIHHQKHTNLRLVKNRDRAA
jgi:two-component system chemotaxis sensor kinase CheA